MNGFMYYIGSKTPVYPGWNQVLWSMDFLLWVVSTGPLELG